MLKVFSQHIACPLCPVCHHPPVPTAEQPAQSSWPEDEAAIDWMNAMMALRALCYQDAPQLYVAMRLVDSKPRNPRHFDTSGGRRKRCSDVFNDENSDALRGAQPLF